MTAWVHDVRRAWKRAGELIERRFVTPGRELKTGLTPRFKEVRIDLNVPVPMRDGVILRADVYRPEGPADARRPVVLIRMPYGKQEDYCYMPAHGKYWARQGYACVIQDVRGRFASEGKFDPFVNEAEDGWDTLDWVAAQPWCDGNIGMTGESYYGYTQWAVAPLRHPALKAIVPGNTAANIYGIWFYVNGAFALQTMGQWSIYMNHRIYANPLRLTDAIRKRLPLGRMDDAAGIPSPFYKDAIAHPTRDAFWERINQDQFYGQIDIPALSWGGWYDTFLKGTLEDWWGMMRHPDPEVRRHQYVILAPTDHEISPWRTGRVGALNVGGEAWSYDWIARFFDRYLMGIKNGLEYEGRVRYFVMGPNVWRWANAFPPLGAVPTRFYLHSGGSANTAQGDGWLDTRAPDSEEPADGYVYDPDDPVTLTLQTDLWYMAEELKDRTQIAGRQDVLHYTGAPLEAPLEITGLIQARLYASSSAPDTDFTVTLVDVAPDGHVHLVQEGIVRARWREGSAESFLTPGAATAFDVDLWATSYVFQPGHRVRVEVSSSNFDRYDRNPNTGDPFGQARAAQKAEQRIFHAPGRESHIVLPVMTSGYCHRADRSRKDRQVRRLPVSPHRRAAFETSPPGAGARPPRPVGMIPCAGHPTH
ncbi:MAG: CocE/NonD family hydrolase [Chloroflexi bacterium]|nr:CocE/NonD family hydrolase [Chloroflexota bacterium]